MSFARATSAPETLSPKEQKQLLAKTGTTKGAEREHMMYSLVLGTALREHEVAGLNVADVVHAGEVKTKITLTVFKGSNIKKKETAAAAPARPIKQIVYLPKAVRRKLVYYLKWKRDRAESLRHDAPLFSVSRDSAKAEQGQRLSTRTLRHHFRRWQERCNFETLHGFHVLRHTALSNLYRATKDILVVKAQARHGNVTTTQIYMHVDDDVRKAVEDLEC